MTEPVEPIEVDAVGMACPLPVIELAKAVGAHPVGTRFRLRADDEAARVDIPVWCRMQGQQLQDVVDEDAGIIRFDVEKVKELRTSARN